MSEDDVTKPWHDCTNTQATYDFVKEVYGLNSSDYTQFEENMDNIGNHPGYNEEVAKEMTDELASLMPVVLPMFCGTTLSGCETIEKQSAFRKHLLEMIENDAHQKYMKDFFVMGMTFICLLPEGVDMFSRLQTHEECMKLFDVWYNSFAGPVMKDYFEPLPEEDKQVVRVAFLGGLLYTLTKNKLSNDDFIPQGCMYKPIK